MTNIKVIKLNGRKKGKNTVIMAGVHGNEKFGVEAIEEILPSIKIQQGTLTIIYANLEAIRQNKRFIEYNLNRCFLKKQSVQAAKTLEGKTAKEIIPYLEKADVLLDIHGSNTPQSPPFVICQPNGFAIAEKLPFEIISYNWDKFHSGSSDAYINSRNKIGIAVECGYLGDEKSILRAKEAITSFLKAVYSNSIGKKSKKYFRIIKMYKNKYGAFRKRREFADFELLGKDTAIGTDGKKTVMARKGETILFVRDRDSIGDECFLTAKEETFLNCEELRKMENKK